MTGDFWMQMLCQIEANILLWIQEHLRNEVTDPIVKWITHLGDHGILWIALLLILLCISKTRKAAILGASSLVLTFVVTNLCLKPFVARVRPYEAIDGLVRIIEAQSDKSFPSGHTANSMAVGVILWKISQSCEKLGNKKIYFPKFAGWFVLILSILIGLSRLYVGVHYPTDILGGAVIAMVVSVIVFKIYKNINIRKRNEKGAVGK